MRVLVIDDELGIREGCRRVLTANGFEVDAAENGPAGLHKLHESAFDILLVDAMMPGMSGLEVLQQARKNYPELICILITGYATVELAVQAIREGAHDFVAKPFTPTLLMQVINRELDRRKWQREARRVTELEEELRRLARVRAEKEALEAVQSRFMLTMVHILRAPVAVLQNSVQLIRKGYVPPEEGPSLLERIDTRAGELLTILDDVLLLSRVKEGMGKKDLESVSLGGALQTVLGEAQGEAAKRGLTLVVEPGDEISVAARPEHIQILWKQLLSNALRYTPAGGRVTVSLRQIPGDKVTGCVADTGIGIAPEEIPRIFEDFYRAESAKAMQETGTGLGLPIVQQIVTLYGGTMEMDSIPGQGSSFRFLLPRGDLPGPGASQ
ncbi:MAG TPA: hybrid sensor histidine kinase/response regulator [Thermodesulfobacteriota bacterium]|nr:hybrid sensor histidine kinase/response regulator [Thermodesulfobacteriota bacterium]